ncbi:MAG: TAXI family TRAP transporter solute-binding subunit [Clostridia bacterium]|nr:TAXI family TRAP transporter solute-binding subunit [Clostridia bacterium]
MKRGFLCILTLILLCVSLAGCGGSGDGVTLDTIHVGTAGSTGSYYSFCQAAGIVLEQHTDYTFDIATSGGSRANIESLVAGTFDMAIVQNDVMSYAYNGVDMFNEKIQGFSVVGVIFPEALQVVTKANSGINRVADLAGKRVSVGDAGSGSEFNARQVLGVAGIDMATGLNKQNLGYGDSASAIKDGTLDAYFCVAPAPATHVSELTTTTDVKLVSLSDDLRKKLKETYTFYIDTTITHEQYSFIPADDPVETVGVAATLIISNDISTEQVYNITKALWENKDSITHAKVAEMDLNNACTALGGVPLHPGAEQYYREIGLLK